MGTFSDANGMLSYRDFYCKSSVDICLYRNVVSIYCRSIINIYICPRNRYCCVSLQTGDFIFVIWVICIGPIFSFLIFQSAFGIGIIGFIVPDVSCYFRIRSRRKNPSTVINHDSFEYKRGLINKIYIIDYGRTRT